MHNENESVNLEEEEMSKPEEATIQTIEVSPNGDAQVLEADLTGLQSSSILFDNDFDLYNLLKDMISTKMVSFDESAVDTTDVETQIKKIKKRNSYKNYTKSLTARLLDSHFTDGRTEWCLIENGMDLYRSKIKCIGTDSNDFGYGEPIFFDLQPLSTRIKLMCKLIIIIQGACLERTGPPKLVQDRCLQFDGVDNDERVNKPSLARQDSMNLPKIKSNSCENLLNDLNG